MQDREYQTDSVRRTLESWGIFDKVLGVAPTGSGKTVMFTLITKLRQAAGRVLIIAHREELIDQAIAKLHAFGGIFADKEKAEFKASMQSRVVVASIQTLMARKARFPVDHWKTVIVDECHHRPSASYCSVLDYFQGYKEIGVTATADRSDKKNLGSIYEEVAFELNLLDLIKQGFLSKIVCKTVPLKIDLTDVRKVAGDFSAADLGDALAPVLRAAVEQIRIHAADRKRIIVFLPLCATSRQFVAMCNEAGITARHIDGESGDRKEIQSAFSRGEFRLLANSMLLTEGYDEPGIDCVIVLRPTQSRGLYSQMIGRGTRLAPGKENLLILDFLWNVEKHSLIKPAHLIAGSKEEAVAMTDYMEQEQDMGANGLLFDTQQSLDLEMDLEDAMTEVRAQREASLRKKIEAQAKKSSKFVDPIAFGLDLHEQSLSEFEPTMPWHSNRVTDKQRALLEGAKIDPESVTCAGHAAAIIDKIMDRRRMGLATPSQFAWLKKLQHPNPSTTTFEDATKFLDSKFKKR